jgi:hypothetical protein
MPKTYHVRAHRGDPPDWLVGTRHATRGERLFDGTDTETAQRIAIVNETTAKRYSPNADPIGGASRSIGSLRHRVRRFWHGLTCRIVKTL